MEYPTIGPEQFSEMQDLARVLMRRRRPPAYRSFIRAGGTLADAARDYRLRQDARMHWPPTLWRRVGRTIKIITAWIGYLHIVFWGVILLLTCLLRFINPAASAFMVYRSVVDSHKILRPLFIPLRQIPRSTVVTFVYLEDHDFYTHHGINPQAIREAAERNARYRRTVFGGSTITQQLARNLFLTPDRTFLRKYLELYASFALELFLGKDRIMELYLNYIEFGRGAFGIGRGAYFQYGRPFGSLNYDERSRLAVIITNPLQYSVDNFMRQPGMAARYQAVSGQ